MKYAATSPNGVCMRFVANAPLPPATTLVSLCFIPAPLLWYNFVALLFVAQSSYSGCKNVVNRWKAMCDRG